MLRSAAEIARAVNAGECSAAATVEAALARAEALDPVLNAFVALDSDRALAEARVVDARLARGERLALAGVPVPLKASQPPDGALARRLRACGAVVIGSTAIPAPGYHQSWGDTPRGRTRNPRDPTRSPGGSSAGAAAAVGAGIVPLATGGDSAGSLRIPAAWCGVVGHKPTVGRIPRRQVGPYQLTTSGAITRSVEDQRLFLGAVGQPGLRPPLLPGRARAGGPPLRAAWSSDLGHVEVVEPDVAAVARARADELAELGTVVFVDRPVELLSLRGVWGRLRRAEKLALAGRPVPADLVTAAVLDVRTENLRRLARIFDDVDVLLLPTTPVTAQLVDEDPPGYECELTWMFNVAGLPATSVPAGTSPAGLPVGLQIVAPAGDDETCLALAAALEQRHGVAPAAELSGAPAS